MVKDPVWGMNVDESKAAATAVHRAATRSAAGHGARLASRREGKVV
jgi:hypothetical protein